MSISRGEFKALKIRGIQTELKVKNINVVDIVTETSKIALLMLFIYQSYLHQADVLG